MNLVVWFAVLGAVQAALGVWVIIAQPRRLLNWSVGALLLLWAGSGVMYQLAKESSPSDAYYLFNRIGDQYEAPTFLLIILIIGCLMLPERKPRWWNALLAASGVALVFFWISHSLYRPTFELATRLDGVEQLRVVPDVPAILNATASYSAQAAAVLLAVHACRNAALSKLQRRQAALVGLAFALLLAHGGGTSIVYIANGVLPFNAYLFLSVGSIIFFGAAIYGAIRLPAAFEGPARIAITGSVLLAFAVGLFSPYPLLGFKFVGGRAVVLSAFSLVLAVAVLRYDLAGARPEQRRRLQVAASLLLGLCFAAILTAAFWSLSGQGLLSVGVGFAALLAPLVLIATPMKRLPAWLTRRVLLHPRDPEALRERVRVYASTLRAATGRDGHLLPATEPALAALRTQLGLAQRDHDLLVAMGGDQSAGGIVAYRLALVGAAANAEKLDASQLVRLREDLSITERDHALVVEHVEASADSLSAGALFLGRYHILRRLGEGGLGEVWLARDARSDVDVVLKHLVGQDRREGAALKRIQRELGAASLLEHPHIVRVRDVEMVGDESYLVMEYMRGGSLAEALLTRGALPEPEVIQIAADILDALAALHARRIVHRDVKPANILLDERGVAKLADFNISRELVSGDTLGGDIPRGPTGTFAYMPPEQARGLAARPQSDLFSLGATLFEAVSGAPFRQVSGLSHTEAVALITQASAPASVPHASARLEAAILRALAPSPEDRFSDASQMRAAIIPAETPGDSDRLRSRPLV